MLVQPHGDTRAEQAAIHIAVRGRLAEPDAFTDALGLRGKPEPDTYREAARRLGVPVDRAVVVEDALAGGESQADVDVHSLLAVIDVPYVSQVYMVHRGRMRSPHHGPTPESSETRLMTEAEIPWDEIAFPTVWHSLKYFFADRAAGTPQIHTLSLSRTSRDPAGRSEGVSGPMNRVLLTGRLTRDPEFMVCCAIPCVW